jgi:hypothetical protein
VCTPSFAVLALLGVAAGWYGLWLVPSSNVPRLSSPDIELDFAPGHSAKHPIAVDVRLLQQKLEASNIGWRVLVAVELQGDDLKNDGWSIFAVVPTGVRVEDTASPTSISRYGASKEAVAVAVTPGSQPQGKYTALFGWDKRGPIDVEGADLTAAFPTVRVENQTDQQERAVSRPEPDVSVQRELDLLSGDYAPLGGLPPDQITRYAWFWQKRLGNVNQGNAVDAMTVEARSASVGRQEQGNEFRGGIWIGVAAAALIAAVQEFLKWEEGGQRGKAHRPTADELRMN